MNEIDVSRILGEMQAMAARARGEAAAPAGPAAAGAPDFTALLRQSLEKVNEAQQQAGTLAQSFEAGDPRVDLAEVMVALQKASLSFEAMTQVRNKLVSAYQEIMSMQV